MHPGLIVLREGGLTRDEQWDRIRPVIEHVLESSDDNFLVNKLVEISGPIISSHAPLPIVWAHPSVEGEPIEVTDSPKETRGVHN
jgi:hypothetical protein